MPAAVGQFGSVDLVLVDETPGTKPYGWALCRVCACPYGPTDWPDLMVWAQSHTMLPHPVP